MGCDSYRNSHWLACLLAQGHNSIAKWALSVDRTGHLYRKFHHVCLTNRFLQKGEASIEVRQVQEQVISTVKAGLTGVAWNGPTFKLQCRSSLCTILLCVKDACMLTGGDPSRGFYTNDTDVFPSTQTLWWGEMLLWKSTSNKFTSMIIHDYRYLQWNEGPINPAFLWQIKDKV